MIAARLDRPTTRKEDPVPGHVHDVRQDLEDPWREAQRQLAASVHEDTYRLWFSPLSPVSRRGATLYLTGPQRVIRWVGRRYMELLRSAILRTFTGIQAVELVAPDAAAAAAVAGPAASRVTLNPAYTFDR
ncbi:MAG: DnaA N-terminal domain-containing protein, partial [Solirubrobacterales bacterium]